MVGARVRVSGRGFIAIRLICSCRLIVYITVFGRLAIARDVISIKVEYLYYVLPLPLSSGELNKLHEVIAAKTRDFFNTYLIITLLYYFKVDNLLSTIYLASFPSIGHRHCKSPPVMSTDTVPLTSGRAPILDTSSLSSNSSSLPLWDRLSTWASENKTIVYTIAGIAVVVTGAGLVYYSTDSRTASRDTSSEEKKRLSKKERKKAKKDKDKEQAQSHTKTEPEQRTQLALLHPNLSS